MDPERIKTLSPTEYYTGKASIYHNRARYSEECIRYLINRAAMTERSVIADIGAGIGNLTRQFLQYQPFEVFLVEPNEDMFRRAQKEITSPCVHFFQTTAEMTGLPDSSVDLVVVGTAFHWFDREAFRQECLRICKKDAIVAILRLFMFVPDFSESDSSPEHTIQESDRNLASFFCDQSFEKKFFFHEEVFDQRRFIDERLSDHKSPNPGDHDFDKFVEKSKKAFSYFGSEIINNTCITVCISGKLSE